jgi:hypothetical protein
LSDLGPESHPGILGTTIHALPYLIVHVADKNVQKE